MNLQVKMEDKLCLHAYIWMSNNDDEQKITNARKVNHGNKKSICISIW